MAVPVATSCQGQPGTGLGPRDTEHHPVPPWLALVEIGGTTSCPERSHWLPSCAQLKQSQRALGTIVYLCPSG